MPQLDKFPILFQFKSFVLIFLFLYFFFLLIILPIIHTSLRLRKINIMFLLLSNLITEMEITRVVFISYITTRNVFINYIRITEIFFNILNKKVKINELK